MKNKIEDLRNHLFATLEDLRDPEKPMDLARARAVSEVAGTIIESAKVEVEMLKMVKGHKGTGFIPLEQIPEEKPVFPRLAKGGVRD